MGPEVSARVEVLHLVDPHPPIQNYYFKLIRTEKWHTMYNVLLLMQKKEKTVSVSLCLQGPEET